MSAEPPLRVLHVVQGYAPAVGGTERVIQRLSEELVARYGDEVTVFITNIDAVEDLTHGFCIVNYGINMEIGPQRGHHCGGPW